MMPYELSARGDFYSVRLGGHLTNTDLGQHSAELEKPDNAAPGSLNRVSTAILR